MPKKVYSTRLLQTDRKSRNRNFTSHHAISTIHIITYGPMNSKLHEENKLVLLLVLSGYGNSSLTLAGQGCAKMFWSFLKLYSFVNNYIQRVYANHTIVLKLMNTNRTKMKSKLLSALHTAFSLVVGMRA